MISNLFPGHCSFSNTNLTKAVSVNSNLSNDISCHIALSPAHALQCKLLHIQPPFNLHNSRGSPVA